jgi:hypothetical protein
MRNLITPLISVVLALSTGSAWADGLLYQLPADGSWVLYDALVTMTRENDRGVETQNVKEESSLKMSSVGTSMEDGILCRWIEFNLTIKFDNTENVIVAKILIPESSLVAGKNPVENRIRGWIRNGIKSEVVELTDDNLGPIPVFLANPLTDVKALNEATIEIPGFLTRPPKKNDDKADDKTEQKTDDNIKDETVNKTEGIIEEFIEVKCKGLSGQTEFYDGTATHKVSFITHLCDKVPFGVVKSKIKIQITHDDSEEDTSARAIDMTLTLRDANKTLSVDTNRAKSELPKRYK